VAGDQGRGRSSATSRRRSGPPGAAAAELVGPPHRLALLPARQPAWRRNLRSSKARSKSPVCSWDLGLEGIGGECSRLEWGSDFHFRLFGPDGRSVAIQPGRSGPASRRGGVGPRVAGSAGGWFGSSAGVAAHSNLRPTRGSVGVAGLPASRAVQGISRRSPGVAAWLAVFRQSREVKRQLDGRWCWLGVSAGAGGSAGSSRPWVVGSAFRPVRWLSRYSRAWAVGSGFPPEVAALASRPHSAVHRIPAASSVSGGLRCVGDGVLTSTGAAGGLVSSATGGAARTSACDAVGVGVAGCGLRGDACDPVCLLAASRSGK